MHTLYILLFALGIYTSVGLIQVGQTSPALPCQIELPFTNPHISVFYKQPIVGIGCVTNLTTKTNQEVHVINLKKSVAVYRNEVAEVHLFVKSRNDEVLWEPLIIVLNSINPVKWRVRTEILAPARKKHIFVIPGYSSVKLVKGNSRRIVRRINQLPEKKEKLLEWVKERYGAVTSFAELDKGNQITLHVGPDNTATSVCEVKDSQAKTVDAIYEKPKPFAGCMAPPRSNIMERLAYVIELEKEDQNTEQVEINEVELEIKSGRRRKTHRNFYLVLKSPWRNVTWRVKTKRLEGYAEIVSNSKIDISGIKMDPVSERIEDFTETGEKFLKWVEKYVGQVAMYTAIHSANKIKMVIPDTDDEEKIKSQILNDPFDDIPFTKKILNRNARTECISPGVIKVSLSKTVYQTYGLDLYQMSLISPTCIATQNASHIIWESAVGECKTRKTEQDGQTTLHNALLIHRSPADAIEAGSGYHYDNIDEDELNISGSGSLNQVTETYIDDEDYRHNDPPIISDVSCQLEQGTDKTTFSHSGDKIKPMTPPSTKIKHNMDLSFRLQLFKSPLYLDANYLFPMNISLGSRVFVDAAIEGDKSMRVQIKSCHLMKDQTPVMTLIQNGCKNSNTNWEPVVRGKPLMGSVTQSQRFSFSADILSQYLNQYIYISCHLTVCRNYQTADNEFIPQCIDNKDQVCRNGLPPYSPRVPNHPDVTKGPMKVVNTGSRKGQIPPKLNVGVEDEVKETEKQAGGKQSVVVDGLESGTVICIAFAAFFIGVLLMAALWFIHTHTGPSKRTDTGKMGIDGSGESTPMSTAPIAVNT
ncbi:transforming growth factor beta receptor type 3-like isoform X3 [Mytilus edulis]|uniref:transforming growth factor beta receptor type 3-like isoform X3 n=1 Tax=Mytilus edulis TaxID=6550 RepID=UPI0039F04BDA